MSKEYIVTYTGKKVYPLALREEDLDIKDIAHALANKCRFTGHTKYFYSVAQHSILVALRLPFSLRLSGLLHDAGEAYLPDISSGIKHCFPLLNKAEEHIMSLIEKVYNLPHLTDIQQREIKRADVDVCYWEGKYLMPQHSCAEWVKPWSGRQRVTINPEPPAIAKQNFLIMFNTLNE